jgi:uncharacterized protein YaiL (DUF2058 family)
MGMSLRDQLIQAGLVTEQQAKLAAQQQPRPQQQSRRKSPPLSEQQLALQRSQAAKTARDQELNRKQQAKAERAARWAQVRQLVEQSRLPRVESEDFYHFTDGGKIKRIAVNPTLRAQLQRGEMLIVRCDGRYEIVPAAAATRIAEREASAVMGIPASGTTDAASAEDGTYSAFVVPDDLVW